MTYVIYHGGCVDGFTAAWAVRRYFLNRGEPEPKMFAAYYPTGDEDTELPDVTDHDVIMVDFCVRREQLLRIKLLAKSLIVLDHHKSHREACAGLEYCMFDMDRSGAAMAWDWFFAKGVRPWLVSYVQDRDLWKFELPDSRTVSSYMLCQEMTWENWDRIAEMPLAQAVAAGIGAEMYVKHYVRTWAKEARRMPFPKHQGVYLKEGMVGTGDPADYHDDIPVVNAPYLATSELVGYLAQDAPFAVAWYQRGDGRYQYSLRSRGECDVSKVAEAFGGGGHAGAAGFVSKMRVTD